MAGVGYTLVLMIVSCPLLAVILMSVQFKTSVMVIGGLLLPIGRIIVMACSSAPGQVFTVPSFVLGVFTLGVLGNESIV